MVSWWISCYVFPPNHVLALDLSTRWQHQCSSWVRVAGLVEKWSGNWGDCAKRRQWTIQGGDGAVLKKDPGDTGNTQVLHIAGFLFNQRAMLFSSTGDWLESKLSSLGSFFPSTGELFCLPSTSEPFFLPPLTFQESVISFNLFQHRFAPHLPISITWEKANPGSGIVVKSKAF